MTQLDSLWSECVQSNSNDNGIVNDSKTEDLENDCSEEVFQEVHTPKLCPDDGVDDSNSGSTAPDSRLQPFTCKHVNY